ncbi:MAG: error-prone DNA polymerase, partial [Phycisphaeraceae bacterium]|nr:error-prone DNA polymerase [Phycisphaeraceae bacterium]
MPDAPSAAPRPRTEPAYAELSVRTNYDFLTGASHPEELVERAAELGLAAIAVTDTHTLGGVVRAHVAARQAGLPLVVGSRVLLRPHEPGPPIGVLLYPTDRDSYGRLCRLLTIGKRRADKGDCVLTAHDLLELHAGLLAVVQPPATPDDAALRTMAALRGVFDDDRLSVAIARRLGPDDDERFWQARALAQRLDAPLAAVNDVLHHAPERRPLQDVLTCVRHGCTLADAGLRLQPNGERHLKPPAEMARLMAGCPQALARSVQIARRAGAFSLDCLRYEYPDEVVPPGATPMSHLAELTWAGARERYPRGVPEKVRAQILHELALIDELRYAPYFLTVHDIVRFARGRRILCQGRGAAANSAVCYCLGVTSVDPDRISLLFERFISRERNEPPDIDIDFEHERREEVLQYIYGKYGRDRAALTAEIISYRGRSAVREIGKALGLSLDCTDRLARNLELWSDGTVPPERLAEIGLDPADPTIRRLAALCRQAAGFPRHRSQHVGGFVISRGPLCETVPIENAAMPDRTVIEWDKDDLDAMGLLKIDCLGLGMLTCIRKTMELVNAAPGPPRPPLELHTIPPEDAGVYDMICRADTVGVFQIESRAQMSMLPRLRPRCFYDLVIEVAIVRPGPIQGKMVHPYLRRRNGQEPAWYPDERVRAVLGRTLGVPLFQEQAMALAIVAAGFTPGEADALRRAMAAWKRKGDLIVRFGRKIIDGMTARGYSTEFAERCVEQIKGFSEYGFPESHAASFALLVYASCWLKHHHPAAFGAALLNSQPMGFYAPAQIVRDAQEHGVEVRPIDVNASRWDCTLEHPPGGGPPAL